MTNLLQTLAVALEPAHEDAAIEGAGCRFLDFDTTPDLDRVAELAGMVKDHLAELLGDDVAGSHDPHGLLGDAGIEPAHELAAEESPVGVEVGEHDQLAGDEGEIGLEVGRDGVPVAALRAECCHAGASCRYGDCPKYFYYKAFTVSSGVPGRGLDISSR